jgi:hypothetical protein
MGALHRNTFDPKSELFRERFDRRIVVIRHQETSSTLRHQTEQVLVIKLTMLVKTVSGAFAISSGVGRVHKVDHARLIQILTNNLDSIAAFELDRRSQPGETAYPTDKSIRVPA